MNNEKYNGWTNYATWRINLEIFDGVASDMDGEEVTPESCKDYAEEIVFADIDENSLAASYALAFMREANWHEIAEAINDSNSE